MVTVSRDADRKLFLDGVRGWAALVVVAYHTLHCFPHSLLNPDKSNLLNFLSNGPIAVYIFFVLSGFVLSVGFFETGDRNVIFSGVFRRYVRLTIPVAASCLIAFCLMKAGAMHNPEASIAADSGDWLSPHYLFVPSWDSLLKFALWGVYLNGDSTINYNAVLWTMPLELFGSMLVFAVLFGLSLCRLRAGRTRFIIYGAGALGVVWLDGHLLAFVIGMVLADLYCLAAVQRFRAGGAGLALGVVGVGLCYALATGEAGEISDPAAVSLIAACFVVAVVASRRLAALFETPVSAFLGRISFPIYLIHLELICSASSWLYLAIAGMGFGADFCAALTQIFTLVGSLVGAVLFAPIERFSVRASRGFAVFVLARTVRAVTPANRGLGS